MIKKTKLFSGIGLLIICIMMLSMIIFADSTGTTEADQTNEWVSKGWARLYPTQAFQTDKNLTRGELVALINSLFELKDQTEINFLDVTAVSPYYKEVSKAFKAGYIVGRGDNTFNPEGEVSRLEAYIMIGRVLKLDMNQKPEQMQKFSDVKDVPGWGLGAVEAMTQKGWINDKSKVKPFEKLTGSETVALLEKVSPKTDIVQAEIPAVEEEVKGGGIALLTFKEAFFVSISDGKSVELTKLEEGNSSSDIIIKLVFDRGVVRENWENNKQQIKLQSNNGSIIASEVFRIEGADAEKEHIFIKPLETLKSGKTVNIVIGKDLMANNGNILGEEEIITFTVK